MLRASKALWCAVLLVFFVLMYLLPLNGRLLWQPDEVRYAEMSREMLQSGNWVVPHLLGLRYFEKPIAGIWINSVSQLLFSDSHFAVRFGSVFCTLLSALMVFWLGTKLWRSRQVAFTATLIYLSSTLVFSIGTYSVLDPMITLWMTAAMLCSYYCLRVNRRSHKLLSWVMLGLACGMGFMTKGFLALAVPVIAVLPVFLREKRFTQLFLWGPVAVIAAILLSLPWVITVAHRESDFWHYFFWVEHIQRFAEQNAQHKAPFWYYIPILCLGSLPWLGLLPGALAAGWKKRFIRGDLFFLLSWVVMPLIFFSIAKGKLPTYILPCFAPLALLMAENLEQLSEGRNSGALKANAIINLFFGIVAVCALIVLSGRVAFFSAHIKPIYGPDELHTLMMGVLIFAVWGLAGLLALSSVKQRWHWAAVCPLVLGLLVGQAVPQRVVDSKQPEYFLNQNIALLQDSHDVLADNVGVATGIAWILKRSDILMYDEKGELTYGLGYPDAKGRYIEAAGFAVWLEKAREAGNVSIVLSDNDLDALIHSLPVADIVVNNGRMALLQYKKLP
jgi:4-amino-4-deoxy-L-arabinose transferase